MNIDKLDKVLEALLLVSGDGLKIADLKEHLSLQKTEINAAVKKLKERFSGDSGIHLVVYNDTIQLGSNPDYKEAVESVLNPIKQKNLSNAVLETVAIVAYRQPITRLEIEHIRGVNCDYAVQILLSHNLIEVVGRKDAIGKPLLFGTTDEFLKRFRIESISDLPDYEQLLENIKLLNVAAEEKKTASLYNEFEIKEDGENGAEEDIDAGANQDASAEADTGPESELPEFLEGEEFGKLE